jgi:hypothetical protein
VQQSQDPSEEQKLLLSVLLDGDPVVLIDNVERPSLETSSSEQCRRGAVL